MSTEAVGPRLTTLKGELDTPIQVCYGCPARRIVDYHYFFCRHLGDQSQPDVNIYLNSKAWVQVNRDPICHLPAIEEN